MEVEIKIPSVGESVQEAVLVQWYKKDGDPVQKDEPIFVVETDKVTLEIVAEASGILKILVLEGETVSIGTKVGTIATGAVPSPEPEPAHPEKVVEAPLPSPEPTETPAPVKAEEAPAKAEEAAVKTEPEDFRPILSPAVEAAARVMGSITEAEEMVTVRPQAILDGKPVEIPEPKQPRKKRWWFGS